jgi:hypothetical protein
LRFAAAAAFLIFFLLVDLRFCLGIDDPPVETLDRAPH